MPHNILSQVPGLSELSGSDETTEYFNPMFRMVARNIQEKPRCIRNIVDRSLSDVKKNITMARYIYKEVHFIVVVAKNSFYRTQIIELIQASRKINTLFLVVTTTGYTLYQYGSVVRSQYRKDRIQKFMDQFILRGILDGNDPRKDSNEPMG